MKKARYIRRGDIIKYTSASGQELEEVVRDVQIFFIMANGENVPVDPTLDVAIIPQEEIEIPEEEPLDPAIETGITPEEDSEDE